MSVFKQLFTFLKCTVPVIAVTINALVPLDFMKLETSKPLQGDTLHPQLKLDLDQA